MADKPAARPTLPQSPWFWVLCLVGLDYFSTLAYQPSLAFEAARLAAPFATAVVVLVTLGGALPVYAYVAARSPHGQGSTGLLEDMVRGWLGKLLIVTLLGFAATDFVITRTLSTADAAVHLIHNPDPNWQQTLDSLSTADESTRNLLPYSFWQRAVNYWNRQLVVTLLLSLLSFIFWAVFRRGFTRRVIQIAIIVVLSYLVLTALVVGSGLCYLVLHPELLRAWWAGLGQGPMPGRAGGWGAVALRCLTAFPQMALGVSGLELSMVVLPLIRGEPNDDPAQPRGRIRNARKLLLTAASIMAVYLLGAGLVTTTLIAPDVQLANGRASNRALAYLAHGSMLLDGHLASRMNPLFGRTFGTIYDLATILILCLAGTSITIALRNLVPQSLHRLGMELEWAHNLGAILYVFNGINLAVTLIFRASVTAQRGAYATSVLTLLSSAAVAAALDRWRRGSGPWPRRLPWGYAALAVLLNLSTVASIFVNPAGLLIALCFVVAILVSSIVSRAFRSMELRFEGFCFKDDDSRFLWESLKYLEFPVLVPHRPGRHSLLVKEALVRHRHRLAPDVPVVFVEAELGDASNFFHQPLLEVREEEERFLVRISRCVSIAHVIAAAALELSKVGKPPEIHFGWSNESPVEANLNFLLFGQGNIPWMVRELIRRSEPDPARRPPVVVG
jgi:hypothetical protein